MRAVFLVVDEIGGIGKVRPPIGSLPEKSGKENLRTVSTLMLTSSFKAKEASLTWWSR